jgi:hypothetical protein
MTKNGHMNKGLNKKRRDLAKHSGTHCNPCYLGRGGRRIKASLGKVSKPLSQKQKG